MARSATLLLWAQALVLAGPQPSQLLLEPPWMPVFIREQVTLTCQGSGTPGNTHWSRNGQLWLWTRPNHVKVTSNSPETCTYQCQGPGAEQSPQVTLIFSHAWLLLQVPVQTLLEGDELQLRCRSWTTTKITQLQFFHEGQALKAPRGTHELLLSPLQLQHSGRYVCRATLKFLLTNWQETATATVTVHELFTVPVLRLEGSAEPPEGAPMALDCLSTPSPLRPLTRLQHIFYRDREVVEGPQDSPRLRLPAVELLHSGSYSCEVWAEKYNVWKRSAPITVTVRRIPVSEVSLSVEPPEGQVAEGDRLVLSCWVAAGTGPLSFSWHREGSAAPVATGSRYELSAARRQDSGRYRCAVTDGGTVASSPPLQVSVLVPVAGATIVTARTEPSVPAGESLNLSCSVQAGTAPVTFTWLRDGQELGPGPVLALGPVAPEDTGTYKCLASNRLGAHRVFQALSPGLSLSVTPPVWGQLQRRPAVAVGLSVSFLLLLFLGAAAAWHLRRRAAARKSRDRDPTAPPEPQGCQPEPADTSGDGEVLYSQVVVIEGTSRPHQEHPPESPVTYSELPGRYVRQRIPSDTYENVP